MNILRIRIIVLLERLKKVTAVADELGVKQPTVSFHMRKMEEEWGVSLFEFKSGKVRLTEAGKLLHRYAVQIDGIYTEAESRIDELKRTGRNRIAIGCTDAAAAAVLNASWFAAAADEADLQLLLITGSEAELHRKLRDGTADLVMTGAVPHTAELQSETVLDDRLVLLVPSGHPLAITDSPASFQLAGYRFVIPEDPSIREAVAQWETNERLTLQAGMLTDRITNAVNAVRSGTHLALVPSRAVNGDIKEVCALRLPGTPAEWKLIAYWKNDFWNPKLAARMLALLSGRSNQV